MKENLRKFPIVLLDWFSGIKHEFGANLEHPSPRKFIKLIYNLEEIILIGVINRQEINYETVFTILSRKKNF